MRQRDVRAGRNLFLRESVRLGRRRRCPKKGLNNAKFFLSKPFFFGRQLVVVGESPIQIHLRKLAGNRVAAAFQPTVGPHVKTACGARGGFG